MTEQQQRALTENIETILEFYQFGQQGHIAYPGGFVALFREHSPELYEENKDFILFLDKLILAINRSGSNSPPL